MAQVGEIVARFKAETSDYMTKLEAAKVKNKEVATELLKNSKTADEAITALNIAKSKGALGEFGLDKRQVSGVISELKAMGKQAEVTAEKTRELQQALSIKAAAGRNDLLDSFQMFARGDILGGIEKYKKGIQDIQEAQKGGVTGGGLVVGGLAFTAVGLVAEATRKASSEAVRLKEQYDEGKISAGQMADGMLKQVPIVGAIYETTRNVLFLFGLESRTLEEQEKIQERINKIAENRVAIYKKTKAAIDDANRETQKILDENNIKALEGGGLKYQAQDKKLSQDTNREIEEFKRKQEEFLREQKAALSKQAEELARARKEAKKSYDKADSGPEGHLAYDTLKGIDKQIADLVRERAELEAKVNKAIQDRTKALKEQEELQRKANLDGKTPGQRDAEEFAKKFAKNFTEGKGKPLTDWIKQQIEEGLKNKDKLKSFAEKVKEGIKTDSQKLGDEVNQALLAKRSNMLTPTQFADYLGKNAKDLQAERKQILASEKSVYQLPDVKDFRGGQALYVPPNKVDEKALERLTEIDKSLKIIAEASKAGGVTLQVIK